MTDEEKRTINRPVPFDGSQKERIANRATHNWGRGVDGEALCLDCEVKPWHIVAQYPCGTEPPREDVEVDGDDEAVEVASSGWRALEADITEVLRR